MDGKVKANGKPKKNTRKRNKLVLDAVSMKSKSAQPNLFETIFSRRKFDILGKKRKGEERRIAISRSTAIDKRNKTLRKEYEQKGKSSLFVDKRIGEHNELLGEFDKAIMRSQRERQSKLGRKSKYNLSDGEEEGLDIQYFGSLNPKDDFEDEVQYDDDNLYEEEVSGKYERENPNGELIQDDSMAKDDHRRKSKKEVMEEIIKTSKYFKAQKSRDNEEKRELVGELDDKFKSLLEASTLLPLIQQNLPSQKEKPDSFDILVNEMVLDARVRPSDRKKTPEEIAHEEKEILERLEEERRQRMIAADHSSDDDVESTGVATITTEQPKHISGDYIGDSFSHKEEKNDRKGWVDEIYEREKRTSSGEGDEESSGDEDDGVMDRSDKCENGEDYKAQIMKDWEQSDDENVSMDSVECEDEDSDDESETGDENGCRDGRAKRIMTTPNSTINTVRNLPASKELLPFVIECPVTLEDFHILVDNRSESDIIEAIHRIRTCNAIKLAAENRRKMQVFYGILLQYFAILASKKPMELSLLNLLVRPLMEMSVETPYFAAICARERISQARVQFCKAVMTGRSCWPSAKMVTLLRLWSMIFPCTDFRHSVQTPAILLICEYLMRSPVISGRDAALGCFLCSMLLLVTKQSEKFCPEGLVFLQRIFSVSLEERSVSCEGSPQTTGSLLHIKEKAKNIIPLSFTSIVGMDDSDIFFSCDNFRAGVLFSAAETLHGFVEAYQKLNCFPEIFHPVFKLLSEVIKQENIPDTLIHKLNSVTRLITEKSLHRCSVRRPLQMLKQKPLPIKLLTPKFEENFVKGIDYDPDRERVERRKLKKRLKGEMKGAARELRKDNHFLFELKERQKTLAAEERAERHQKARAFLQEQEKSFKSGLLGKGKKRRR